MFRTKVLVFKSGLELRSDFKTFASNLCIIISIYFPFNIRLLRLLALRVDYKMMLIEQLILLSTYLSSARVNGTSQEIKLTSSRQTRLTK